MTDGARRKLYRRAVTTLPDNSGSFSMEDWKFGNKVVSLSCGRYLSAIVTWCGEMCLTYEPGRDTVPISGCGPAAVFDTYANARAFVKQASLIGRGYCRILPCIYRESKQQSLFCLRYSMFQGSENLPPGTRLADVVMVLEPLEDERN